jgi:hypothetical protein
MLRQIKNVVFSTLSKLVPDKLAGFAKYVGGKLPIQDIRNLIAGWRHRSSTSVAAEMLRRYPHCYLVNGDFGSFPRVGLTEYRTLPADDVPLVRVSANDLNRLVEGRKAYISSFLQDGATLVAGDGELPFPTARSVILGIAEQGWHILTVDDARHILEDRDVATSKDGYLTTRNGWLTETEKDADAKGIAESLFPFCEQVVATRAAIIVIYTPALPKPLKLWRLSLKWIMPSLPPVV